METIREKPRILGEGHPILCSAAVILYDAVKTNRTDYVTTEELQERLAHIVEAAYAAGAEDMKQEIQDALLLYPTRGWATMLIGGPKNV